SCPEVRIAASWPLASLTPCSTSCAGGVIAALAAAALVVEAPAFEVAAEPAATARMPTNGTANAATATTTTIMKSALFMFIPLPFSKVFGETPKCGQRRDCASSTEMATQNREGP